MASLTYDSGRTMLAGLGPRWDDAKAKFWVLLAKASYEPKPEHKTIDQVKAHELSGSGYERRQIEGRSLRVDPLEHRVDYVAKPVTFNRLYTDAQYRWAVVFQDDGTLVAAIDMTTISLRGLSEHTLRWDGKRSEGRVLSVY
ncbi:MAG TPA: hypothetical protein VMI75_36605 [Polyangiaceae bacterium]|nr:hypothetical protein [Polyangiaceae bacterium]